MTTAQEQQYSDLLALSGRSGGTLNELMIAASRRVTGFTPGTNNEAYISLLQSLTGDTTTKSLPTLQAKYADMLQTEPGAIRFPTWARDFSRVSSIGSDITFTRASAAYYTNSDGTLTSFASGQPRIGSKGILIEEARTNLLRQSAARNVSPWASSGSVTVTADAEDAPDGTTTADRVVATASGHFNLQDTSVADDTTSRRFSVFFNYDDSTFVRFNAQYNGGTVVTPTVDVNPQTGGIITDSSSGGDAAVRSLADSWFRLDFSSANNGLGNTNISCQTYANFGSGEGVYTWISQLEVGDTASSPILTTSSSVTRAADVATPDVADGDYDILIERENGSAWTLGQTIASNNYDLPVDMSDPYIRRVQMFDAGLLNAAQRAALAA